MMENHIILGVDIGGTGIKGGLVDIKKGEMVTKRYRVPTPQPATPDAIANAFTELVNHFEWKGVIGVGFPAIVQNGIALSATNIDKSWVNINIKELLSLRSGCDVHVLNDADAAGIAAMHFDIGENQNGVVIMLTIGTGIGSALFTDGKLVPNTEIGHVYLPGQDKIVEKYISKKVRLEQDLSWMEWGRRFNNYLKFVDHLFSPELIILGGGGSKKFDDFKDFLDSTLPVQPATLRNRAGTIGAAYYSWEKANSK